MVEFNWSIEDIERAQRDFSNNFMRLDCIRTESYDVAIDCMTFCIEHKKDTNVSSIRRGRWIDIHEYCKMNGYLPSGVAVYYWCSECMKAQEKTSDFCPCCGADMREV